MNRQINIFVVLGMVWSLVAIGNATADSPAERFLQQVKAGGRLDAAQVASLEQELASSDAAAVEAAVTSALCRLYPNYEAAVRASDDDDLQQARQLLGGLTGSEDRFLAADASFYLARTLMNHERFEEAKQLLDALNGPLIDYSTHRTITQYYQGLAQAGLLQNDEAIKSFMEFLQFNADAPERLRVSAWRQVQEIQAIKKGEMDDIYQRMDFSRRRLEITEPGERTQEEQDNIVKMLKKLISEQEKKEASSSKGKGKSESESQQQQQQAQNQPKDQSESQSGGNSSNPNGKFVEKSYDTGNASPWSRLRDRSRDPANTAIKDKLPARYREIVERYYDAVNGNESGGSEPAPRGGGSPNENR
jgi:tetratricopeptide (TPR) repeat protein